MPKTVAKKPSRKAAPKSARKAVPPPKPVPSARKAELAKETARQEAARGKLERVRVPSPKREDGTEGKYVYCVIRSDQPLSFQVVPARDRYPNQQVGLTAVAPE